MTLPAANSLLKLLEEAPPRLLLILLVENQHQVLPTILSRCQRIPFESISPASVDQQYDALLSRLTHDGYELCAQLSAAELEEHFMWVSRWSSLIISNSFAAPSFLMDDVIHRLVLLKDDWLILDLLLLWWRELINQLLGREEYFFPIVFASEREKQAKQTNIVKILKGLMRLLEYRNKLGGSVRPPQLSLEYMTLTLQGEI